MRRMEIMGGIHRFCDWVMKLAILNLLWIFFSLAGLIVLGIAPSTVAMFTVIRKYLMGMDDIPLFKTYWHTFRAELIKANLFGGGLFLMAIILFFDINIIKSIDHPLSQYVLIVLYSISLVYVMTVIYFLPMYVHYKLKAVHYLKNAFIIGISNPLTTILILMGIYFIYLLLQSFPLMALFFSGNLLCLIMMWGGYRVFLKNEQRVNQEKSEKFRNQLI